MSLLQDKVAIITGGNSGIGRAIAGCFASQGARVTIAGRRAALTRRVARAIGVEAVPADVSGEADVRALVRGVVRRHKRLDILVNSAGLAGSWSLVGKMTMQEWDRLLAVNLTGAFLCSRAALPAMRRAGGGQIVMVSSVYGREAKAGTSAYSASKFGMMALAASLLDEELENGIRTACLLPGKVDTPMQKGRRADFIRPEDVAAAALYLVTLPSNIVVRELRLDRRGSLMASGRR